MSIVYDSKVAPQQTGFMGMDYDQYELYVLWEMIESLMRAIVSGSEWHKNALLGCFDRQILERINELDAKIKARS